MFVRRCEVQLVDWVPFFHLVVDVAVCSKSVSFAELAT